MMSESKTILRLRGLLRAALEDGGYPKGESSLWDALWDAVRDELEPSAAVPEPPPCGEGEVILPLVIQDLEARAMHGKSKYGTLLKSNNGRNALMDAYQEALDLVMYLRQCLEEQDR
jgi:hypothetical protein